MSSAGSPFEPLLVRPELNKLLRLVDQRGNRGVEVVGGPGTGKTTLLRMAETELTRRERAVFWVSCRDLRKVDELGSAILAAVRSSLFAACLTGPTIVRSSGGSPLLETAAILREAALPAPVLFLDGLDEAAYPDRLASGIQQLKLELKGWSIAISSRMSAGLESRRLRDFERLAVGPLTFDEIKALARMHAPDLSETQVSSVYHFSNGLPFLARILAQTIASHGHPDLSTSGLSTVFARWVDDAIETAEDPTLLGLLIDELALFGGSCEIKTLSARLGVPSASIRSLINSLRRPLFATSDEPNTVSFFHQMFQDFVLAERVRFKHIRLAELDFGAEEAEKDSLLASTFVKSRSVRTILDQRQSVIVGDRGSGKSALFRKLSANDKQSVRICPIVDTGDLLHRIVANGSWRDAQAVRAAWLVVIAAVIAGEIPETAPKKLHRTANDLRAALGLSAEKPGRWRRLGHKLMRPVLGTKLSFAVGPVTLQAELPAGTAGRQGKALLDVASFLRDADAALNNHGRRVVVMVDRIDETFKYDREKQEPVVQALLQAEGHVTMLDNIGMILFIRTDLFELYDIQEKNKLVSRTLTLDWDEEEWFQVLIGRVLANDRLQWLADRAPATRGNVRSALPLLFPAEMENQPVDRWLLDALRNGNGDISPRLAVLLLHLARKRADETEFTISSFPIFSASTLGTAMTQLSELSFSEVINDFKVASSFVLNCRAGRLDIFNLDTVTNLFNVAEGPISQQVRLLERLGFLERVVRTTDTGAESLFRIPKLYTRCWDYA